MQISRKFIILFLIFLILWYTGYIFYEDELDGLDHETISTLENETPDTVDNFINNAKNNTTNNTEGEIEEIEDIEEEIKEEIEKEIEEEYTNLNNSSKVPLTTKEKIILINQKYCGQPKCEFLYVYTHPEQETKVNIHFRSFTQLSEALNRTMVLTNVGYSQMSACKPFPFDFYYNIEKLKEEFSNSKFIEQSKFLNWVEERNLVDVPADAKKKIPLQFTIDHYQMYSVRKENNTELLSDEKPNIKLFRSKGCFDRVKGLDLTDAQTLKKIRFQNLSITDNDIKISSSRQKFSNFLIRSLASDSDVILIRNRVLRSMFPIVMPVITYADHIIEESNKIREKLSHKYIAIHWRMEGGIPELLPQCARGLVETIKSLIDETEIKNVYLATDYPLFYNSQSSTFRTITENHKKAIEILKKDIKFNTWISLDGFKKLREDGKYDAEIKGSGGLTGILDKLICIHANYFISGPRECARATSSYTKTIAKIRNSLKEKGDESLQNVILRWNYF